MKVLVLETQSEKFEFCQDYRVHKGIFDEFEFESKYQPYGGIPERNNESSPVKNNAQVGLRWVTDFSGKGMFGKEIKGIKFISQTRSLVNLDSPENFVEIFFEVAERAFKNHRSLLDNELKKMNLKHSNFAKEDDEEKNVICWILIDHFRPIFEIES